MTKEEINNSISRSVKSNFWEKLFHDLPHSFIYYSFKLFKPKKFKSLQTYRNKQAGTNEYSLQGFDKLNCIFVHIPKTAGVSISQNLFGNLGGGHKTITDYHLIYSPSEFNRYFKFTIVRNPWDRLVSAYFFLKEGGFKADEKEWFDEHLASYNTFEEFVLQWVNQENIYTYNHFIPQYHFVTHRNKLAVNKFYKLENITSAVQDISTKLGVELSLSHKNKTKNRKPDYREYYNSRTKKIINQVYQRDITLFDYTF